MNELVEFKNDIGVEVIQGKVGFARYEEMKEKALKAAEQINQMEITEDTVKESKKVLANVNKDMHLLDTVRIGVKKYLLEPYLPFEVQVNEIKGIIKGADTVQRDKVGALEEKRRLDKWKKINEIWDKRVSKYTFADLLRFTMFCDAKHLNATVSMSSVEKDMVAWLEQTERDLNAIQSMNNSDEITNEYLIVFDIAQAMAIVEDRIKQQEQIKQFKAENDIKDHKIFVFTIENEKDAKLTEMLLKENNITFIKEIK